MTLGRKWSPPLPWSQIVSSFIRYFSKIVTSSRTWVTIHNLLQLSNSSAPKVNKVCCCIDQEEFSGRVNISHEALKSFSLILARRPRSDYKRFFTGQLWHGGKELKTPGLLIDDPQTTNRNPGSFEQHHLDVTTRKPEFWYLTQLILGGPRPHHESWFQEVKYMLMASGMEKTWSFASPRL